MRGNDVCGHSFHKKKTRKRSWMAIAQMRPSEEGNEVSSVGAEFSRWISEAENQKRGEERA